MKCPQCKKKMKPWVFDVGFGVEVPSKHCTHCQFNVTADDVLEVKMSELREKMKKQVKIVAVGEGLGVRFPKTLVEHYGIKKGSKVLLQAGQKGIKVELA